MVDQAGVNATLGLWGNNYLEANAGYLHGAPGAIAWRYARLIFPLNSKLAFTVEGDMNETLVGTGNSGRAVGRLGFRQQAAAQGTAGRRSRGSRGCPQNPLRSYHQEVRNGDDPPVADAGPNQVNVPAGPMTLNGSASYSPDGNPITFQWVEVVGPPVTSSAPTGAITTFTAVAGQTYTFRLTVKDNFGG